MFTVQQIKAVHATVKSGADFPRYVREIKALGLIKYEFMVEDGLTIYFGENAYKVEAPAIYPVKAINPTPSADKLKQIILDHQAGKSNFPEFCQLVAEIGVHHWEVNAITMMCNYYDINGNIMLGEPIPQGEYA